MNPIQIIAAINSHNINIERYTRAISEEKKHIANLQSCCNHNWTQVMQGADAYRRCTVCGKTE